MSAGACAADSPVPDECRALQVKLLVNARDFHGTGAAVGIQPRVEGVGASCAWSIPNWFTLYVKARGGAIATRHDWYENFDLSVERERGLSDRDSHLCVGEAELTLHPGEWVGVVASLNPQPSVYLDEALRRAQARDLGQLRRAQVQVPELIDAPTWVDQLVLAADSFVFARPLPEVPDGESVIAGYPWFGDWGRDTMIALPGLTLATGRYDTARRILQTFARFVDQGMLPNVFPGAGDKPEYNTVDAALWYIEAWRAYVEAIDDRRVACARRSRCSSRSSTGTSRARATASAWIPPTDCCARASPACSSPGWTPRSATGWSRRASASRWRSTRCGSTRCRRWRSFAELLKLPSKPYARSGGARARRLPALRQSDGGGLFDVLDGPEGDDATLRPNQIFAVSLPFSPLDRECQAHGRARCAGASC